MSSLFPTRHVKILTDDDFITESDEKITMKNKSLNVVLFHTKNDLSKHMVEIWNKLVDEVTGPYFCACDLTIHSRISDRITEVSMDETSPYYRLISHKSPFILVYRNGRPQKDYRDSLTLHKLILFTSGLIDNYSDETKSHNHNDADEDNESESELPKVHRKH